jgi:adenylate cyclase
MKQKVHKAGEGKRPASRSRPQTLSVTSFVDRLANWLIAQALADAEIEAIIAGCCERFSAAGVPIYRAHLSLSVLHPLYSSVGYLWRRGEGLQVSGYRHLRDGVSQERYLRSPYFHLRQNELSYLRRRLDPFSNPEFPVLEELRDEGATDYLAYVINFEPSGQQGMMGSWATDRKGGFGVEDIEALLRIQERLAVACKVAIRNAVARRVLSTYLGRDAGGRVLSGQIRRGDGETVRAAIVWGDLRESTAMAERLGREAYTEMLNLFFDTVAGAIEDAGGEILSLVGDAFLAVFPSGRNRKESLAACRKALAGALEAPRRMAEINETRKARGEVALEFGLGLHVGNVMYGNVGLVDRLSFSAFGAAVNEAVRLQEVAKTHDTPIVASADFVDHAGGDWDPLGEIQLRGFEHRVPVYRPRSGAGQDHAVVRRDRRVGLSDAEAIVLLQRHGPFAMSDARGDGTEPGDDV